LFPVSQVGWRGSGFLKEIGLGLASIAGFFLPQDGKSAAVLTNNFLLLCLCFFGTAEVCLRESFTF